MKLSLVFLASVILALSAVFIASYSFLDPVLAQPEDKNPSENSNSHFQNDEVFAGAAVSLSSDTASTIGNKDKELIGRQNAKNPKIHPAITQILENANPEAMAQILGAELDGNQLTTYVYLSDLGNLPPGIEILAQDKNIIESKLDIQQIQTLAKSPSVEKITLPDYARFSVIDESEGVTFSLADKLHLAGFNGSGITVAVIDDSFITNNTQISGNIISQSYAAGCADMACGYTDGNSHGTAVAEIVVDMAPGVNLRLYSIKGAVDFANAVDYAIGNGTDVITASLGFPTLGGDGTNIKKWYRDGTSSVAKKVNDAKNAGLLFTVASGNNGATHWSGTYVANSTVMDEPLNGDLVFLSGAPEFPGYQSVMIFNSTASGNMKACLPVNNVGDLYIASWNAWPTTTQDYDIFLYSSDMQDFLGGLNSAQYPFVDKPQEKINSEGIGDACLVLASFHSTEDHLIHIDTGANSLDTSFQIPATSLDTPADSVSALTVGAVSFNNTITDYNDDFLEDFSSQGPTDDSRVKPEICGPDRNFTHQTNLYSPEPGTFPGTSAATPHVAGAAALLLQQDPSLTVDQLKQKLIYNARFDADFSVDNKCGSDSGSLQLPLDASISIVKTANGGNAVFDFTTTSTDTNLDGNFTGNGGFTIDTSTINSVKFTGLSPAVNYTITESPESGWKFNSVSCSGATTSISGQTVTIDPIEASQITCTYTNTKIPACTPPDSGNWVITTSCILNSNHTLTGGNIIIQNNSVLEIPSGVTLDIDFASHNLTVKSGSGVLIKSGGKIT